MKLQSVIKMGFLMRAIGELKAAEEVSAVRHFLNGFICDL
jgi:hypothetical protein